MKNAQKQWLYSQIYLYIQQQKYTKAITLLKALITLAPNDLNTIKTLARAYLGANNYLLASKYTDQALSHELAHTFSEKELALLHLIKSRSQLKLNQISQAKESLDLFLNFRRKNSKSSDRYSA